MHAMVQPRASQEPLFAVQPLSNSLSSTVPMVVADAHSQQTKLHALYCQTSLLRLTVKLLVGKTRVPAHIRAFECLKSRIPKKPDIAE